MDNSQIATTAFAITPSDSAETVCSQIYVGVTGDVKVVPAGGSVGVVFKAVPAGAVLPIRCKKVLSTGTTATDLVGLG